MPKLRSTQSDLAFDLGRHSERADVVAMSFSPQCKSMTVAEFAQIILRGEHQGEAAKHIDRKRMEVVVT